MQEIQKAYILMLGPPGVGKGVYSAQLSKDLGINCLSSGDELRKLIKDEEPFPMSIQELKETMAIGKLVNNIYMISFMLGRLEQPRFAKGAILDGFPRTTPQAKILDTVAKVNLVVKIDLKEDIVIRKMLGRRHCFYCNKSYNNCAIKEGEYDIPKILPVKEHDKCDGCNKPLKLVQREDDNEESIKRRLKIYNATTRPLERFYKDRIVVFQPKLGFKDYPKFFNLVKKNLH